MNKDQKFAYQNALREKAQLKARERYWEKIFANVPDESMKRLKPTRE